MTPPAPLSDLAIAFIGGGNMARALVAGLCRAGHSPQAITVVEPVAAARESLAADYGVRAQAAAGALEAQLVVLAVKPQQMAEALAGLRPAPGATVLSIAAGLPLDALRSALPADCAVVRSMPNTPALVGAGISALYAAADTPAAARTAAEYLLAATGACVWVDDEAQLDAVTAVSGSGPAYFYLLTEAMAAAGAALGLPADTAARLARQTLIGAGRLAEARREDVTVLRAQVTSRGGTTEAALQRFEAGDFHGLTLEALRAAHTRSADLGEALGRALQRD